MTKFIVIELCDNDFGPELDEVAAQLAEYFTADYVPVDAQQMRSVVVDLMIAFTSLRDASRGYSYCPGPTRDYLRHKVRVTYHEAEPYLPDHDGGSVAVRLTDKGQPAHFWRF